jgi:23S rRNA pseudouridine2605 synthase
MDLLPPELRHGRLFHVGRLDRESSGLLLLSDDGDLAHALLHPSHPIWKRYRVQLDRPPSEDDLRAWRRGEIELDGRPCLPARVRRLPDRESTHLSIELREGRNRQIRRMVEARGRRVMRLHRVSFGPLQLGRLGPGKWRAATDEEWSALRATVVDARPRRA